MVMLMKILFLDIDGVLNSQNFTKNNISRTILPDDSNIDPQSCKLLEDLLVSCPDLYIVISSTWRRMFNLNQLQNILKQKGLLSCNKIIDYTPSLQNSIRGNEIQSWLDEHPEVSLFAILDDDNDMGNITDHLIQTDFNIGLTSQEITVLKRLFS